MSSGSFGAAFRFWLKLGFINFGGPAGQIAIMHRELVEKRKWLGEEQFLHALNFCMLLPGPEAQQLATYIGWLKHGVRGGLVAGTLFVLPGLALIVTLSFFYAKYRSLQIVDGVLFGFKAAVLAIVIEALLRIAKRALKSSLSVWVAVFAFLGLFLFALPFPLVVATAALLGYFLPRPAADVQSSAEAVLQPASHPFRTMAAGLALWFVPILVVVAFLRTDHILAQQAFFFSKMAVVTFGGAYAALSYVAQEAVANFGWLTADDMLQGLALAETTPGPLILVLSFVGFQGAFNHPAPFNPVVAGMLGALLTTWVTFVPCFLWIFLGAPYIERLRRNAALSSALAMVTAAVVGVILNLSVWFGLHALFHELHTWRGWGIVLLLPDFRTLDWLALALAASALFALVRLKAPLVVVLGVCAIVGVVAGFTPSP